MSRLRVPRNAAIRPHRQLISAFFTEANYENAERNTFSVANQWTIVENSEKRPDGFKV